MIVNDCELIKEGGNSNKGDYKILQVKSSVFKMLLQTHKSEDNELLRIQN